VPSSVSNIDDDFYGKLVDGARRLGVEPVSMALVMFAESGINPKAFNAKGGASGINQFMPATLNKVAPGLDPASYRQLSASQQLDYVLKFWASLYAAHPGANQGAARDLYWLNFYPATYVPGAPDDYVITTNPKIIAANPAFGSPITPGGLKRFLDKQAANSPTRWNAIVDNIQNLTPPLIGPVAPSQPAVLVPPKLSIVWAFVAAAILGGSIYLGLGKKPGFGRRPTRARPTGKVFA
jgi:hypothetical protein